MARETKNSKKEYRMYAVMFISGCLLTYILNALPSSTSTDTYLVRKPTKSKYVSPLLLGSDSTFFYEDSSFSKELSRYILTATKDGSAADISVYVKNLTTGRWTGINENEHYAPASLMKVPIMIAILKQAESDNSLLRRELYYDGTSDLNQEEYYKPQNHIAAGHSYSDRKSVV